MQGRTFLQKVLPCTSLQKLLIIGALAAIGLLPQKHQTVLPGRIRGVLRRFPGACPSMPLDGEH
jgi:hypothetical protein